MTDEVTEVEERINADLLGLFKDGYQRLGALAVPVEASVASKIRTLLGEAHQAIISVEESPAAHTAAAVAIEAAAAVEEGAPAGTVPGAGAAPGGGPGASLPVEVQEGLNDLAAAYEEARTRLLDATPAKAPAEPLAPIDANPSGGAPTGAV